MDRYFYILELDENKEKIIHMQGNVYYDDIDETDTNYRIAEWTFLYLDFEDIKYLFHTNTFYEFISERVNYIDDISKQEANKICRTYFDGESGERLHILDINENTPCGCHWFQP